ncbi:MAG: Baseplate J-like protein [Chloroflexi bacterium ADurb.Bin325]|nr:MAG: Baseplate J-like protein [Chloroflexi bacterium ADurb.Bin325]
MATQYRCLDNGRRALARDTLVDGKPVVNGIDALEVLDQEEPDLALRQRTLVVLFFHAIPELDRGRVRIEGGVRIAPVNVDWAVRADRLTAGQVNPPVQAYIDALGAAVGKERLLVVRTDVRGDFSAYRLVIERRTTDEPAFDPLLSAIDFSFKVECPSEFDCRPINECPPTTRGAPTIDYLARDYASFRRLMLDRLAVTMPGWQERNPADVGVAIVETLAYAADHLSYYQDAAATEAYLGAARRRTSIRRHARLLDYPMHDGANARAWVALEVAAGSDADGGVLPGPDAAPDSGHPGATLLTQIPAPRGSLALTDQELNRAVADGALVFETLHDVTLHASRNELYFHTWGDERCCLPKAATSAALLRQGRDARVADGELKPGDVLIFEEVRGPDTGQAADLDPTHRHAVRLTEVTFGVDPLNPADPTTPLEIIEIAWDAADALPFPLCLWTVADAGAAQVPVAVARGNVVLADHGRTIVGEPLVPPTPERPYRPRLAFGPLTRQGRARDAAGSLLLDAQGEPAVVNLAGPAADATRWEMRDVLPAAFLLDPNGDAWRPQPDLLASDRFARDFVAETEDDGRTALRFGDGVSGARPIGGLVAAYRIGNGRAGNIGAESLAHVVNGPAGITGARNPLPAAGGEDPESADQVRLYAPQAFRTQERAVTEADYAAMAERHAEVQRAAADRRWTGSWYTMFVTVDRRGTRAGSPARSSDRAFRAEIGNFLQRYRLAGHDLEIARPIYVSLDIALTVCVAPGYVRANVRQALNRIFSSTNLPDGTRGFFHPDNFTFGQPVYLSQIIAAAMQAPGVSWIDVDDAPPKPNRFRRWGKPSQGELAAGYIPMGWLEIARLDNDPNRPENGKIEFIMQGGL